MADLYSGWQSPRASASPKLTTKAVVISAFIIVSLGAILGFSLYGRGLGDPSCQCTTQGQASWNMGSAVMTLIFILGILVLLWRPELLVRSS